MSEPTPKIDDEKYPQTKQINGQTAVRFDSKYPEWPGCVYVPKDLTPQQYLAWWQRFEEKDESVPSNFKIYRDRYDLILAWHIEGLPEQPPRDPLALPSASIHTIVRDATQKPLVRSQSAPN